MINYELIIKLRKTTRSDVLMIILEIIRLSKENYFMDYQRLLNLKFMSRLGRHELNNSIYLRG